MKYTHAPLHEDVHFLAGSYALDREERVPFNGRDVLYVAGQTGSLSTCCGTVSPFSFIKVVGFVEKWHHAIDENGAAVSEVELVKGDALQNEVRDFVHMANPDVDLLHKEFW